MWQTYYGFGGPQGCFAAESQMNKRAEALGMDLVELRLKNILAGEKLLTLPAAAAVISAVHDAIGVRFSDFPLTAERVWRELRRQREDAR